MKKYNTIIFTELDEKLIAQWKKLWEHATSANIFNSYEWFLMYKEADNIKNYEIHACFQDKKLVAIMPLYTIRRFGVKVSNVIGDISDTPFLMEKYDKKIFRSFFDSLIKKKNFYLMKVDEKASTILHEMYPQMFFPLMSVNPYLDIDDAPLKHISASNLADIRKILRKNDGKLQFVMYDDKHDLEKYLQLLFTLEGESAKKFNSRAIFSKEENRRLFENFVTYCRRYVQIGILSYENTPIAAQFGFQYKNTFLGHYIVYLFEYRKLSPGKITVASLLPGLVDGPVTRFDFGGGISSYKQEFTPLYHCLYDVYFSNNILFMIWWKSINLARRMKQILFPQKNTRDHEFLFKNGLQKSKIAI